jgi:hypothetical protein
MLVSRTVYSESPTSENTLIPGTSVNKGEKRQGWGLEKELATMWGTTGISKRAYARYKLLW